VNNLRQERFILAHSIKGISPSWKEDQGRAKQHTSWQRKQKKKLKIALIKINLCIR
jgi:hypothetical protein